MNESLIKENKSIQKIRTGSSGIKELAKTCVCLANAQGGVIVIGIDDNTEKPPNEQKIRIEEINKTIQRLRSNCFGVSMTHSEVLKHYNGGEYFEIRVLPSTKLIATTADGKIYVRSGDECIPARSEDIHHMAAEKDSFQWELIARPYSINECNPKEIEYFITEIKNSSQVKSFVKEFSDIEILEHYNFYNDGKLTNLGILWLGFPYQRAKLNYPITIQYIVYNDNEEKIRKEIWNDYQLNPRSLLLEIENQATELEYYYELPYGLFRKQVRHYPKEVIRELLVNAFAHKSYTISSDILIEVYTNRFSISNPGGLPTGITKDNILHQRHRRNPHFINIFQAMGLMEGEGSGYDLIYEKLCYDSKQLPIIDSDYNKVTITIESEIIDKESLFLIDYLSNHFELSQREIITLGIISRKKKVLSTELSSFLQLKDEERLRTWVGRLVEKKILITRGRKKGTSFLLNPEILKSAKLNIKPSLKTLEKHTLKALIKEDLKINSPSGISEIHSRMEEIPEREIRKAVYELKENNELKEIGKSRKFRKYTLAIKK
ncbi:MAG: putative DNA binding domain-containing protein [Bacteroidales bacterium]|nr:putative DNA binding domain-containing protein [Bacteroidales bacterium]